MHTYSYNLNSGLAGVGEVLEETVTSALSCGHACTCNDACTGANYSPTNATCSLLHVDDVAEDWIDEDEINFLAADDDVGPGKCLSESRELERVK